VLAQERKIVPNACMPATLGTIHLLLGDDCRSRARALRQKRKREIVDGDVDGICRICGAAPGEEPRD